MCHIRRGGTIKLDNVVEQQQWIVAGSRTNIRRSPMPLSLMLLSDIVLSISLGCFRVTGDTIAICIIDYLWPNLDESCASTQVPLLNFALRVHKSLSVL